MSVVSIRSHKRFAVCHDVSLRSSSGKPVDGMLIEVSKGGCRISNLGHNEYELGHQLAVQVAGFEEFLGRVRWSRQGMVGLCFSRPLHGSCLDRLIRFCRGELEPADSPRRANG